MNADSTPTKMKVTLIDHTHNAVEKLLYTKATRLTQGEETREKIANLSEVDKLSELTYMAGTIPSSWEFVTYTFEITGVTRAFTHQFVRTRTGSYAQQTMRMLPMEKFGYVVPDTIKVDKHANGLYESAMGMIQVAYDELIKSGIPIEDARGLLPTNIKTNIIAQFSLRTLSEMAKSRTGGRTQGEYRKVMNCMLDAVLEVHPWADRFLFPDRAKQIKSLEDLLDNFIAEGRITTDHRTRALKILDQIKR